MTFRSLLVPASLLLVTVNVHATDVVPEQDIQPPAPIEHRLIPHNYRVVGETDSVLNNALQDDLWERIRAGFQMPSLDAPIVKDHEAWVINRPDYLKRVTGRARRYLYYIVDALEKRGMPTELALLPIVESAYNPTAYSPAHASGLWQFIPSTGKTYGLEQTWWYDGRRDVVAATDAAINYFDYLYSLFGDWNLVLASYNWGEGAVGRAVQKNRDKGLPTDFMSLNMPAETRNYVPKLMALKNIISDPSAYGVKLDPIPNRPYFVTVAPNRHIDTKLAAQLADMTVQDFTDLNPAYTKPVIASKDTRRILVPVDKADSFLTRLANYDKPTLSWQAYGTRKGEKLTDIADSHGISLDELRKYNKLSTKTKVATGQILLVPMSDDDNNPLALASAAPTLAKPVPLKTQRKGFKPSLVPDPAVTTPAVIALQEKGQIAPAVTVKEEPKTKPTRVSVQVLAATKPAEPSTNVVSVTNTDKNAVSNTNNSAVTLASTSTNKVEKGSVSKNSNSPVVLSDSGMIRPVAKSESKSGGIIMAVAAPNNAGINNPSKTSISDGKPTADNINMNNMGGVQTVAYSSSSLSDNQANTVPKAADVKSADALVVGSPDNTSANQIAMLQLDQKELPPQKSKAGEKNLTVATSYTVVQGDTLYSIAKRNNLTTDELVKLNKLDGHGIQLGQVLKLSTGNLAQAKSDSNKKEEDSKPLSAKDKAKLANESHKQAEREKEKSTVYTVKQGDTLYSIARKYKVTPVELKKWNDIPKTLQPGDKVKVLITKS
ncbi:LysM peptidoglycan-binding domain-containing protein [Leeia sp. TBRC 13508]|uniref:LysM peptidoglycan-binding domain-containing protein n=1 Tax=Leeia speluncae TaxID=2884804 RepID=A0ABS8D9A3_9NEIS|nr:LysM peptidoglycan-binding domain-containing protein [Leeia speluncae]MCB6184603.1 LysM peptidoglycan-binding domain-containing protein [Leeia speluncae]